MDWWVVHGHQRTFIVRAALELAVVLVLCIVPKVPPAFSAGLTEHFCIFSHKIQNLYVFGV